MTGVLGWSPMLEQYFGMKAKHPDAILLSRVGDFYEAYGDDAETIARALQIALTSKDAGGGKKIAMAGVPHHALDGYLAKLVLQRRVVALAEQLEAPVPNKLVRRDVVRVVTPGTVIEETMLEPGAHTYLAAIAAVDDVVGLAHADVSTGHVMATAFSGESAFDDALGEIARLDPAELVADVPSDARSALERTLENARTRVVAPPLAAVTSTAVPIDGFSHDESLAMQRTLDALGAFVRRVGVPQSAGDAFKPPQYYSQNAFLALDANARKHLELHRALGSNAKATLLATIDRTRTAMGSRLLARWLSAPLIAAGAIGARADCVEAFTGDGGRRAAIGDVLHACFDLERIAQKIRFRRALPRDLGSLRRTLALLDPLVDALSAATLPALLVEMRERLGGFDEARADLAASIVDEPPATLADGGVMRADASPELTECVALRSDARASLNALEERERERSGIKGLKIKYASAFGYAIEIGKAQTANVPADYVRRQTLTNAERYVTPELRELDAAIAGAQARQLRLEGDLFGALLERLAVRVDDLLAAADALAHIDALVSLAQVASERAYVRPVFVDTSTIDIVDG
ncbi:MAG TPA: DNA mismatch repair protein MutS, partial [Candidatus Lustribacter sp.]|nr:DNA mismatch repair protein MutS [Candidatus Lustribacter sp.]